MKYNSILESIVSFSEKTPDKYCLIDGKRAFSYLETVNQARKVATVLSQLGVKEKDCVIVEGVQDANFFIVEFAIHLLNGIFVPVEKKATDEKVNDLAEQCNSKLFISIKVRENVKTTGISYKDLESQANNAQLSPINLPNAQDISEILFSTGTTGKEKGIVLTHKSDVAVAENIAHAVDMKEDNIEMIPSPLNHSHGLRSAYSNFINGGAIIAFDNIMFLKKFFNQMHEYNVNAIDLVPSALSIILKMSNDKFAEFSGQLRYMEFGSAPMMESDREKIKSFLPNTPMYNFYGSTEAGRSVVYDFNKGFSKKGCIGKATCNSCITIVDEDRNPIVSNVKNHGTIACSGSMCMVEYYMDEEETKKAMENGVIYSNDEAYIDEDGDIILLGRKGDVINMGGKKVSPDEIENATKQMPGVVDCGCISIEDANLGHAPLLFVQMKNKEDFDVAKIIRFLETTTLESFKIPKEIRYIEKIPRTFNGKLLRKELSKLK